MQFPALQFDPAYLLYAGAAGVAGGTVFLLVFCYRRVLWTIRTVARQEKPSIHFLASLRNFLFIMLWTSIFGSILLLGIFLRTYHAFTHEEPVAEVFTQSLKRPGSDPVAIIHFTPVQSGVTRHFFVRGDQWVLEGDIIKWNNLVNFLGLKTRYRLTRLRGRYLSVDAERKRAHTVHSLVAQENHPIWRYLYQYGHQLPFISTVYGNAGFHFSRQDRRYLVYVGTSGFVIREVNRRR